MGRDMSIDAPQGNAIRTDPDLPPVAVQEPPGTSLRAKIVIGIIALLAAIGAGPCLLPAPPAGRGLPRVARLLGSGGEQAGPWNLCRAERAGRSGRAARSR